MNWDDLRFLLALARESTMSGAGKVLGVKHTTVARRIRAFEEKLGTRVFDHLTDGYALTQAGENLYQHALIMEEQALAVDRQIVGLDAQLQGELNLTASHDVFNLLIIPQLGLFHRAYPGIQLNLSSSNELANLAARQADIALRMTPKPPDYLIGKNVLPLGQGIYASKKYLQNNPDKGQVILWESEQNKPEWVRKNFPKSTVSFRANDVSTMCACTQNHLGISRLPCYIGDSSEDLLRLDLSLAASKWGVWVLSHVDLRATARVRVCREFLINTIEQQKELIGGMNSLYYSE